MTNDPLDQFLTGTHATIKQAMRQMSALGEKQLFVTADKRRLLGAISDGDIRKWILRGGTLEARVEEVFNAKPKYLDADYDLEQVREMMLTFKIECVPVLNADHQVSAVLRWDEVFAGKVQKHRGTLDVPVVIMAGGKGSRMDPFTRILPKPLVPIGDRPVIEIIMDKFVEYQVKDFYISIFYKARMIKSYFEDTNGKYRIQFLEEEKPLGTIGGLKLLEGRVQGTFIVTNCDVIIDHDYAELIHAHRSHGHDLTIVVCMRHYQIPYGVCDLEQGGTLKLMKEKPEYDLLVNTGMYVMNDRILALIPAGQSWTIVDLIVAIKATSGKIGVFPVSEKSWVDVGQWEEYQKTVQEMQERLK